MAKPLYTPPVVVCIKIASVGLAPGFHPEIVPSSLVKMNIAGWLTATGNAPVPLKRLNTIPVGVPLPGGGTVTTRGLAAGKAAPFPSYTIETPLPFEFTHQGPLGLASRPQAFTRFTSVLLAPPTSET